MNITKKWVMISATSFVVFAWLFDWSDGWSLIIAVGIGWFFTRAKKIPTKHDEELQKSEPLTSAIFAEKSKEMESEAARVRKQAEKIKREAMDSGIPQLISELYHGNICSYPSWIKHNSRDYVPSIVTEAEEVKNKDSSKNRIRIKMNGNTYEFKYSEHYSYAPGDESSYGNLEMWLDDRKVAHINESVSHDEWGSNHSVFSVDAFISGGWVNDFSELKSAIKKAEADRKKKEFEDPEEVKRLKTNFGIE